MPYRLNIPFTQNADIHFCAYTLNVHVTMTCSLNSHIILVRMKMYALSGLGGVLIDDITQSPLINKHE